MTMVPATPTPTQNQHCAWTVLVGLALTACSFESNCTAMGCGTGLSIAVHATPWALGSYTIEIDEPEGSSSCQFTLDQATLESGSQLAGSTSGATGSPATCPNTSPLVTFVDRRLNVWLWAAPDQVRLRIEHLGIQLLDETLNPDYETHYPNGKDCAPKCRQASMELELGAVATN